MKKFIVSLIFLALLLAACGGANNTANTNNGDDGETNNSSLPETDGSDDTSDGGGEAGPSVNCTNSYFPVEEGRTYTYTITSELGVQTVVWILSEVSDAGFTMTQTVDSLVSSAHWNCTEGGWMQAEYINIEQAGSGFEYTTLEATGSFYGIEDQMVPGGSWTNYFLVEVGGTATGTISLSTTITVVGFETISTVLGNFDNALRMDSVTTVESNLTVDGVSAGPLSYELSATQWHVSGIGLVKAEQSGFGLTATQELISVE